MKKKYRYLLIPFLGLLSCTLTAQEKNNLATGMVQKLNIDVDATLTEQQRSTLNTLALDYTAKREKMAEITDINERVKQRQALRENYDAAVNELLTEKQIALRAQNEALRRQRLEEKIRSRLNQINY